MPDPTSPSTTEQPNPLQPSHAGASRRTVLRAAGLVALVGSSGAALAACGSDDSAAPATGAQPSTSSSPSSSESSSSDDSSSSDESSSEPSTAESSSSSSAKATGPSVPKADVPVGSGLIMPDADYVVTQPEKGTYKAFSKICTHQGCPVNLITNREIVCNCHGSHFSIEDGSVISGPAQRSLPESKTTVSGDNIVIST